MICADCAQHYAEVLSSAERRSAESAPPWERMDADELLAVLPEIAATSAQVDSFLDEWVALLRQRGVSWAAIGTALGVSRQAAWKRYGHPSVGS